MGLSRLSHTRKGFPSAVEKTRTGRDRLNADGSAVGPGGGMGAPACSGWLLLESWAGYGARMTDNEIFPPVDEWWPKLPESVRESLRRDPRGLVDSEAVVAIAHARGAGPAGVSMDGSDYAFHLSEADASWIEQHGG